MGLFDKAKDLFEENKDKIPQDKVDQGIEKAGDLIDERTGGKYAGQVDKGQEFATEHSRDLLGDRAAPADAPPADAPATEQPPQ